MTSRGPIRPLRRMRLLWPALIAVFAVSLALPSACLAKDWRIEDLHLVLEVQPRGDVLVEESVTVGFEGDFSFVSRVIPLDKGSVLRDVAVAQDGAVLPQGNGPGTWQTFVEGGYRVIQLNTAAVDTSQSWTISYRVTGAVLYGEDQDEIRWRVMDADTPVPVDRVRVTFRLPGAISADELGAGVRTGPTVRYDILVPEPSVLEFTATDLPPLTPFWVAAGFPPGTVQRHYTPTEIAAFILPKVGFALPALALLLSLLMWFRRGRDEPQAQHAKYVTSPPGALPPGLAGALIDETVSAREATATILDLARRGYVELEEVAAGDVAAGPSAKRQDTGPRLSLRRMKPTSDVAEFERRLANALFASGDRVGDEALGRGFGRALPQFSDTVYEELVRGGFFSRNPEKVRNHWLGVGILMLVGGLVAGFFLWLFDVPGAWTLGVGLMVAGGVVAGFSRAMPGRTPKGAAEARRWEAFRNYLRDLTRFDDLPRASELWAEHLPYAVAFGVERDWVRRFEGLNVSAPGWYVIAGGTERRPATVPGMHARETAAPRSGGGAVVDEGVVPWSMSSPARPIESAASVRALTLDSLSDRMFTALERLSDSLTAMPASGGSRSSGASTTRRSFSSSSSSSSSRPGRSAGGSWSGSRGGGGYRAG